MEFEEVIEAVKAHVEGKKEITCHDTRHLADQLGVEWTTIGRACDKLGIGLKRCQWAPYCVCDWSLKRQGIAKQRQDAAAAKAATAAAKAASAAAEAAAAAAEAAAAVTEGADGDGDAGTVDVEKQDAE